MSSWYLIAAGILHGAPSSELPLWAPCLAPTPRDSLEHWKLFSGRSLILVPYRIPSSLPLLWLIWPWFLAGLVNDGMNHEQRLQFSSDLALCQPRARSWGASLPDSPESEPEDETDACCGWSKQYSTQCYEMKRNSTMFGLMCKLKMCRFCLHVSNISTLLKSLYGIHTFSHARDASKVDVFQHFL